MSKNKHLFKLLYLLFVVSPIVTSSAEIPATILPIYKGHSTSWAKKIKTCPDEDLLKTLKVIIKSADKHDTNAWAFANKLLSELHVRPYGRGHLKQLEKYRAKILAITNTCVVDGAYNVETAGISKKVVSPKSTSHNVVRPYPYTAEVRAAVEKWKKSHKKTSLDAYIDKYLSQKKKKALNSQSVTYLAPEKKKKYLVTFKNGSIRIGKKKPKDGLYLYALSADGQELLAGRGKKKRFHHTSFFAGAPVQCAGKLTLKAGKIKTIDLSSGHYKPNKKHGENLRRYLSDKTRLGKKKAAHLKIKPHR